MRPPVRPVAPGPGQKSVWDYPRPPRVEAATDRISIRVRFGAETIVDTTDAVRVLQTSHPPVYCLPRSAFPLWGSGTAFLQGSNTATIWQSLHLHLVKKRVTDLLGAKLRTC